MSDLLTIGAFARRCGLTASALRFYADSGLVRPVRVDEESGYRYYSPGQVDNARLVRQLREIGLPLDRVAAVLAADRAEAARIVDDHIAGLTAQAQAARTTAAAVKTALLGEPAAMPSTVLAGPVFTAAVEQVLTAATQDLPVLNCVLVEVSAETITLTATDRYRLSTRSLVLPEPSPAEWTAPVDADDLRLAMPWTRAQHTLRLSRQPSGVVFHGDDGEIRIGRTLSEPFPDYRTMLASLPPARTRAIVSRAALLSCVERHYAHRLRIGFDNALTVATEELPSVHTGPPVTLEFAAHTLHPAISTAVGPDVMLDVAAPHLPVVVRSADNGDLTTLVMPRKGQD